MSMISELVEKLRRYARFSKVNNPSWSGAMTEAADTIEALSEKCRTSDAEPVRHGKWEERVFHNGCTYDHDLFCSVCNHGNGLPYYEYCPYCGAKMDG